MKHYISELQHVINVLKHLVAEYAKFGVPAPGSVNPPVWIVGHACFNIYDLILRPLSSETTLGEEFITLFGTGSVRQGENDYPAISDVLSVLDDLVVETIRCISDRDGSEIDLPQDLKEEGFFSVDNLITHTIQDVAYHNGQISYLIVLLKEGR